MSIWNNIPHATEVDLSSLTESEKMDLMKEYIDEEAARILVAQIDGSAAEYEKNMQRIVDVMNWVNTAAGSAIKIAKLLA